MKTKVLMQRELFNGTISQDSSNGFFSATDLFKVGNSWRYANKLQPVKMTDIVQQKGMKEFIETLKEQVGEEVYISGRGRSKHTWVHPYLFIDMALTINPKLRIKVYQWIYDQLIKYRNDSGDSYKKMTGAVFMTISNKSKFTETIQKIAKRIKVECDVKDWQTATEGQLKLRDKIHEYVSVFSDIIRDTENLIDVAIEKAKTECR